MVRTFLHKVFSAFLALVVLLSTLSFTIEKHFCGDVLVDVSIFTEVEKCAMEAYEMELSKISKKSCCKDVVEIIKGQDELKTNSLEDLKFSQKLFLTAYFQACVNLFEGLQEHIIPHKNYSPPNLIVGIQVLDQVFII